MSDKRNPSDKRNNTPKQLANLMTFGKIDPELQREWSSRGGKARQRQAKARKALKDSVSWLLAEPAFTSNNAAVQGLQEQFPDLTNQEAMTAALIAKVLKDGDPKAYATLRDTVGEMPAFTNSLSASDAITINIKTVE